MKIDQSILDQIRSRPRFKIFTELSREEYTTHLTEFLRQNDERFSGNINSEMALIVVKTEHNHYWKPCLSLRAELDPEENKTLIRGIFGPTSSVWTFFMFLNFIFGISWMVAITIWYVEKQIKSEEFEWALPVSFVMIACLLCTFLAARVGKFKAKNEMQKLRQFAEDAILQFEKN